jgi:hypothetical protein
MLDRGFTFSRKDRMASFRVELDAPNNIVLVMVTEDDGSEHDYQFDFDPRSGRFEFSERDLLERDFGAEFVDDMENQVRGTIQRAIQR